MEWVVAGDHYTIRLNGQSHQDPYTFTLDATGSRSMSLITRLRPGLMGASVKGIYQLSGGFALPCATI